MLIGVIMTSWIMTNVLAALNPDSSARRFRERQGLTLAHFRARLEDLRDTSLTLELNLSTFGTHPRAHLGRVWDEVSLS
jgi:hypothetical protein